MRWFAWESVVVCAAFDIVSPPSQFKNLMRSGGDIVRDDCHRRNLLRPDRTSVGVHYATPVPAPFDRQSDIAFGNLYTDSIDVHLRLHLSSNPL